MVNFFSNPIGAIQDAGKNLLNGAGDIARGAGNAGGSALQTIGDTVSQPIVNTWNWLGDGARTAGQSILGSNGFLSQLTGGLGGAYGNFGGQGFKSLGKAIGLDPKYVMIIVAVVVVIVGLVLLKMFIPA